MKISILSLITLSSLLVLSGCTSNTKLSRTWSDPNNKVAYKDIMVVAIADSEQNRRAFESFFVASFREKGIESLPSYTLISHKDEQELDGEKASFDAIIESAIKGSDIDAVLISHVAWIDEEEVYRPDLAYQPSYGPTVYQTTYVESSNGSMSSYYSSVTTNMQPGNFTLDRTYTLESNLYDVHTEELVWTTRSQTFAPESVDQIVREVSGLIIDDLVSRKLIQ